jgi:hypothetical protein
MTHCGEASFDFVFGSESANVCVPIVVRSRRL